MGTPTRFPSGVTNASRYGNLRNYGLPDPSSWHTFFDDFDVYLAATEWTVTVTGTGTRALQDADGGVLKLTNSAADDDAIFLQKIGESFKFESGKQLVFKARFKVSDATESDLICGLYITDTTPLDNTDGVFFIKADGSTTLNLKVNKNSTATTQAVATMAADTYVTVGFYYDGKSSVYVFLNDVQIATLATTNLPDDEELTIGFGVQNGQAAAKNASFDYILASKER